MEEQAEGRSSEVQKDRVSCTCAHGSPCAGGGVARHGAAPVVCACASAALYLRGDTLPAGASALHFVEDS